MSLPVALALVVVGSIGAYVFFGYEYLLASFACWSVALTGAMVLFHEHR